MCLIIFAYQAKTNVPLVVAANRDEFFGRPSKGAHFWAPETTEQEVLAGRDLQAGGTWLGITRSGRFAAVTNIRDPGQQEGKPRSRGELTRKFLQSEQSAADYAESLRSSFAEFAGYNLLLGDASSMYYVNNFEAIVQKLEPGIYGLSNGMLNDDWPKVARGKDRLQELLEQDNNLRTDDLIAMMADREPAIDAELPDTGVSKELEKRLSSAFIADDNRGYGTLCSTAIIQGSDERIRFSEQNYSRSSAPTENYFFNFKRG